eukprot:scaffold2334_cov138-Skeletonema_menzelii.AAC.2
MTGRQWEELGCDISNNTQLTFIQLCEGALNDDMVSKLFRGLTRSSTIKKLFLYNNHFGTSGIRSMVSFLQNANNLTYLNLSDNNILAEGFDVVFRALRDRPIEHLHCCNCGIESIEIDNEHAPRRLKNLVLDTNRINADGCRGLAKLLQRKDASLTGLYLNNNQIDDNGVEILVIALQKNKSLRGLHLQGNNGISMRGKIMLLKLVNDISSIEATLRSNHTLAYLPLGANDQIIQMHINKSTNINNGHDSLEAGREKVIKTQLNSASRAQYADLQGVDQSVYSEINPLHLPEVLSLIGLCNGQGELYIALKSSIAEVISTVDRKECIRRQRDYHLTKAKQLDAELAAIEAAEESIVSLGSESRSIKKR